MNAGGLPVLLRGCGSPFSLRKGYMDSSLIVNDVSATVASVGFGWTFLGFLCGLVISGAFVYVVSR